MYGNQGNHGNLSATQQQQMGQQMGMTQHNVYNGPITMNCHAGAGGIAATHYNAVTSAGGYAGNVTPLFPTIPPIIPAAGGPAVTPTPGGILHGTDGNKYAYWFLPTTATGIYIEFPMSYSVINVVEHTHT